MEAGNNFNMPSSSSSYPYRDNRMLQNDHNFQGGMIQSNDDSHMNSSMGRDDFQPIYHQSPMHSQQFNSNQSSYDMAPSSSSMNSRYY
jgi:hypothetical protein